MSITEQVLVLLTLFIIIIIECYRSCTHVCCYLFTFLCLSSPPKRSMFTMWAALPGPLILSADLRVGSAGLDSDVLAILTNTEVIAVNQVTEQNE